MRIALVVEGPWLGEVDSLNPFGSGGITGSLGGALIGSRGGTPSRAEEGIFRVVDVVESGIGLVKYNRITNGDGQGIRSEGEAIVSSNVNLMDNAGETGYRKRETNKC